ncbi:MULTISPECIES: TadE/TadG family type IV pilus assembly protein [Olsenella]|uniref:TadE/TadG family type IV pilus assembly protein n=1 Tax=Olsenella TaxID=133925 RepID=UPI0008A23AB7|nr:MULTISPECIES: TadE/TadG family type IV pilus assembly protein [Olsenella]
MGSDGQASVEAALLLPVLMLVLALLVEPACLGYTWATMRSCAAETARVALTDLDGDLSDCEAFARRRLKAVPDLPIFHVGGADDWVVQVGRDGGSVSVLVRGHVRPLPLMGVLASSFMSSDAQGILLEARLTERLRADWIGGGYESWQQMWG